MDRRTSEIVKKAQQKLSNQEQVLCYKTRPVVFMDFTVWQFYKASKRSCRAYVSFSSFTSLSVIRAPSLCVQYHWHPTQIQVKYLNMLVCNLYSILQKTEEDICCLCLIQYLQFLVKRVLKSHPMLKAFFPFYFFRGYKPWQMLNLAAYPCFLVQKLRWFPGC